MRQIIGYWLLVIKEMFPALERGEVISALVTALLAGTAAGFSPLPLWSIPLVAVGALFLWLLILTPPHLREKDQYKIGNLASQLEQIARHRPRFQLSDPVPYRETFYPPDSSPRSVRLYRIRVTNVGELPAEGVEVKITQSEPQLRQGLLIPLHQTDDNKDRYLETFVLPPGEKAGKFIDTVFTHDDEPGVMYIYHIVRIGWPGIVYSRQLRVDITVSAATPGAETYSRLYEAWIDEQDLLQMKIVPDPESAEEAQTLRATDPAAPAAAPPDRPAPGRRRVRSGGRR